MYWNAWLGGRINVTDHSEFEFESAMAEPGAQLPSWLNDPTSFMTSPGDVVADSLKVTEAPMYTGGEGVVVVGTAVLSVAVAAAVTALVLLVVEPKIPKSVTYDPAVAGVV